MSKTRGYLEQFKDNFRALFNVLPEPTYLWQIVNEDLILIDFNNAALNFTNGNIKNYVGVKASKFFFDDPETLIALRQSAIERTSFHQEVNYKYKTINIEKFLSANFGFIEPDLVLVHTKDITDKSLAEQKLRESEENFRTIAEQGLMGIAIIQDNVVKYVNQQHAGLLGYTIEEILSWQPGEWWKTVHPEDREMVLNQAKKRDDELVTGIRHYFARGIHKSGKILWVEVWFKTIKYRGKNAFITTYIDITDKKIAEEKLKESEEKFRTLTEESFLGVAILQDNLIKYVNKRLSETFGYSIEEAMKWKAQEFLNVIHSEDRQFVATQAMKKQLGQQDIEKQYQFRGLKKNGDIIWLEVFSKTINYKEKPADFITILDITKRKLAEQESKKSYEKLKEMEYIINISPGIVFLWGTEEGWPVEFVSENIIKLGYNPEEFYSKQIQYADIIHPDDLERIAEEVKHYSNDKINEFNQEYRLITKSGEVRWIDDRTWIRRDSNGKPTHFQGIILDITDRKKAEEALRESEEKSRLIIENAYDIIYILNKNYKLEYVNEKVVENLLGYTKQELIGKSPLEYIHPEDLQRVREGLSKGFKKGEGRIEVRFKDKKNNYHWFEARGKVFRDIDGNFKSLTIARDMTDRKLSEQKLVESEQKYREAYDRANFYKDLFAHDIRNILQIMSSSVDLISYQLDNPQRSKEINMIINMIKNQLERANRLIKNVNLLSELEQIERPIEKTEMLDLLKNSINFVKVAYQDKNMEIKIESYSNRIFVEANELLQDIFDNLLINAIKYNDSSEIEIFIKIFREQKEGKNYIRMEFIDNGIGITDERKEIIFERGFREHKGHKGLGIGLSLVKKIITSYNGVIWVEDRIKGDSPKGSNLILLLLESVE